MLDWKKLLNDHRRKPKTTESKGTSEESRTEIERDHDRILFSTPVRRLADKTQVFPLERNDSVRTRLTHSHEVSNLSRSIGISLAFEENKVKDDLIPKRNLPALLGAIGLVHDLGNPPFGHQGENAIQKWFKDHEKILNCKDLTDAMKFDFLNFEGNAQTLRLLTRLQITDNDYGLNLTYATLAALMKYPTASDKVDKNNIAKKKHGFFQSEKYIVDDIWQETGLGEGIRHPLTYVMEACDDIAYSVLDAEDAIKKGLVSFSDLISYVKHQYGTDNSINNVVSYALEKNRKYRNGNLSPAEINDISMQMFRVSAIGQMVRDTKKTFLDNYDGIMKGELEYDLIEISDSKKLCETLKSFDKEHAYKHRSVLEVELEGYNTIHGLMDFLWDAIVDRKETGDTRSKHSSPFSSYAYNRISENYRRIFESDNNKMPVRYRELQLLTDMISGMTDSFALDLYSELKQYHAS